MKEVKGYTTKMEEIHHIHKLDAPSGTAITLAEGLIENLKYTNWTLEKPTKEDIVIKSKRRVEDPGTHSIA